MATSVMSSPAIPPAQSFTADDTESQSCSAPVDFLKYSSSRASPNSSWLPARLQHAVGVKQESVARQDSEAPTRIRSGRKHSEHQPVFRNRLSRRRILQQRRMARRAIASCHRLQIKKHIRGGHELSLQFSAQDRVQPARDFGGIISVGSLRGDGYFNHGRDQCCRNSVPRDIGDHMLSGRMGV
jgi:hypothetical protein